LGGGALILEDMSGGGMETLGVSFDWGMLIPGFTSEAGGTLVLGDASAEDAVSTRGLRRGASEEPGLIIG
jgi:hypothetical protein